MNNANNIEVFNDTLKQIEEKYPINPENIKCYSGLPQIATSSVRVPITVVRGGTISTCYENADKMRVAALNFANALVPGGCVECGSNAQEENICRCTNLYPALCSDACYEGYYKPNQASNIMGHPGVYTDRIIYVRDVTVFKDDVTYENIAPKKLDIITCPSPSVELTLWAAPQIYISRIEQIVFSAIENGVDCLVLGAWGCGAFGQDPAIMAGAFAYVLNRYAGYFKKVIFAIRSTPGYRDSTFGVFSDVLNKHYEGGVEYGEE